MAGIAFQRLGKRLPLHGCAPMAIDGDAALIRVIPKGFGSLSRQARKDHFGGSIGMMLFMGALGYKMTGFTGKLVF